MKILIVSLPRTGSTSLMKSISIDKKLDYFEEPYGIDKSPIPDNFWDNKNNIVVKSLIGQPRIKNRIQFYIELSKKFDEVILLSRKDLQSVSESYAYLSWYNSKSNFTYIDKYTWEETPNLKETYQLISNLNEDLINLSKLLKVNITYYEDIFDINSTQRLRKNKVLKDII